MLSAEIDTGLRPAVCPDFTEVFSVLFIQLDAGQRKVSEGMRGSQLVLQTLQEGGAVRGEGGSRERGGDRA